jgi:hypothetical protein
MLRGYVRQIRTWSAKRQDELLKAAGLTERAIYRDGDLPAAIKSLRKGDRLVVGGGLRVLGDNRREITANVNKVRERGAQVMDAETGRLAGGDDGVALLSEAIARIAGEKTMAKPDQAKKMQAASVKARTKGRMGERDALRIWRNADHTVAEAVELMTGWSQANAYRVLGPREIPAGPRGKKTK